MKVQDGIHFIRDKQEIAETQLQLAKLQGSKSDRQSEERKTAVQADSALQSSLSASNHSSQPVPISGGLSLALPTLHPDASLTAPHQYPSPAGASVAVQVPRQIPQNPIPTRPPPQSYYSPPGKILETTHQQYNRFPTQQVEPPHPEPPKFYQPAPNLPQPMQAPQQPQLRPPLGVVNPHNQPPWTHPPEEISPMPSHNYHPTIFQSSLPPGGTPIQQLYMDSSQQRHGQPSRGPQPEFPAGYSHALRSSNFSNVHPYVESSSHYSSSTAKPSQPSSSLLAPGGGGNYTQLPKAQILPDALPTATSVETGSSSGGTGNKAPLDDVVDKVTAMGFRRDIARATVRRLTENGQSVDLNVVLDKLMNGDRDVQSQKSRFGR